MKLWVGEYVAGNDLNVFYAKTKKGGVGDYTNKVIYYTASQSTLSPHLVYIPSYPEIL